MRGGACGWVDSCICRWVANPSELALNVFGVNTVGAVSAGVRRSGNGDMVGAGVATKKRHAVVQPLAERNSLGLHNSTAGGDVRRANSLLRSGLARITVTLTGGEDVRV